MPGVVGGVVLEKNWSFWLQVGSGMYDLLLSPDIKGLIVTFFFPHKQFTRFQIKSLQSPGTYISGRTWDPSQKAITK